MERCPPYPVPLSLRLIPPTRPPHTHPPDALEFWEASTTLRRGLIYGHEDDTSEELAYGEP
eukprot:1308203-Pyramimonas_sp.AAC.1